MKPFFTHLKWQFLLLQKNNIISISLAVTLIYGVILFLLKDTANLEVFLVALVWNDPSVIGYFFIGLAIYTEIKHHIFSAVRVTPVSLHQLIVSRVLALAIIGVVCSLGLAVSVLGFGFNIPAFVTGAFGICTLSALLGLIMVTFASEFLKFTLLSVPVFLIIVNLPLLDYLGVLEMGMFKYFFPVQGSLDLIDHAVSGTAINQAYAFASIALFIPLFYALAYRRFIQKLVA